MVGAAQGVTRVAGGSLLTPEMVHHIQLPNLGEEPTNRLLVLLSVLNGPSPGTQREKHGWEGVAQGPHSWGTFSPLDSLCAGKTVTYQLLPHSIMVPGWK